MGGAADNPGPEVGRTGARFGAARRRRDAAPSGPGTAARSEPDPVVGLTGARFGGLPRRGEQAPVAVPGRDPDPAVGLTGARFGGASRRRDLVPPDPAVPGRAPDPALGLTGARFGGASRERREIAPTTDPDPSPPAADPSPPDPVPAPREPEPPPGADDAIGARPYVLTGGRTRPSVRFAVEALITSTPGPGPVDEQPEHARIRELCRAPRSVAEVAALLGVPLGVARVLLADLLADGAVAVHRTVGAGGPDGALLERLLAGLRRL